MAHPGNTDRYGCHTCRTNCYKWGLSYGEYHCHNVRGIQTTPTCPLFSTYNYLSESCECNKGYIAQNGRCQSMLTYCSLKYGFGATYSYLNNSCECKSGYVFNGYKCESGYSYCTGKYGYGARYNSLSDSCECSYGYEFNGSRCVYKSLYNRFNR